MHPSLAILHLFQAVFCQRHLVLFDKMLINLVITNSSVLHMKAKTFRNQIFLYHRWIGLAVGIIFAIIGLTGSLLVFHSEISDFTLHQELGPIVDPGSPVLPLEVIGEKVQQAFAGDPDAKVHAFSLSAYRRLYQNEPAPLSVGVEGKEDSWIQVYVNPFNGEILGQHDWSSSLWGKVYELHYQLLAGTNGMYFVGVIGLLATFLSITGIALWPGWRKLSTGFKIKWDASTKRLNFDVHKVAGIVAAVFLAMATFTGFLWNFWDISEPLTYTVLLSKKPADPVSQVIPGRDPITLATAAQIANQALPEGKVDSIHLPATPEGVIEVWKKLPQDANFWGEHGVYIDQYSGNVIRVATTKTRSLAEKFINAESAVHYGTFWGIPSRLLYVFVGLSPTILLVTGFTMWRLGKRGKSRLSDVELAELSVH
jgi:uncharacterized iron-regulated membrane protein